MMGYNVFICVSVHVGEEEKKRVSRLEKHFCMVHRHIQYMYVHTKPNTI